MEEQRLTERLVAHDSSNREGVVEVARFVDAWLEARDIDVHVTRVRGLPVLSAEVGRGSGPLILFHGHIDVVPGHPRQFVPRLAGDRLVGRGTYDMKGAVAAMMLALHDVAGHDGARVRLVVVPDEESEEDVQRASEQLVRDGLQADFAITGEPTDLMVGVQAKGVLAVRLCVTGTAAHGATPWLGDNAILKAHDVYRGLETLPFASASSEMFRRPSINLGRIAGGEALNQVPDACTIDVDIRYLPGQDPDEILAEIEGLPDTSIVSVFQRAPAYVDAANPFVDRLCHTVGHLHRGTTTSVGRDGASDAVSFLEAGIPAVEFGPTGGGHHGPEEWVSVSSLARYRRALTAFVHSLPAELAS